MHGASFYNHGFPAGAKGYKHNPVHRFYAADLQKWVNRFAAPGIGAAASKAYANEIHLGRYFSCEINDFVPLSRT
jgi:hypothetical protein